MPTYLKPLRRKFGVVTLGLACLALVIWQRSRVVCDEIHFNLAKRHQIMISLDGHVYWWAVGTHQGSPSSSFGIPNVRQVFERLQEERTTLHLHETEGAEWTFPYWLIVIPLTMLSAWLLLSKVRVNSTQFE